LLAATAQDEQSAAGLEVNVDLNAFEAQ